MPLFAGIDIGSVATKLVVLERLPDDTRRMVYKSMVPSGYDPDKTARTLLDEARDALGKGPDMILTTGYGRHSVDISHSAVTEITCHAKGISFLHPGKSTVIDIGGQDSKAISISEKGKVVDFVMNDKCAAGTGRFLEVMAKALGVDINGLNELATRSKDNLKISSTCTVFAESEVISLISRKTPREDIAYGVFRAIASRVASMAARLTIMDPVFMTGGVCQAATIVKAMELALSHRVHVPKYPQFTGAFGAAIIASKSGS